MMLAGDVVAAFELGEPGADAAAIVDDQPPTKLTNTAALVDLQTTLPAGDGADDCEGILAHCEQEGDLTKDEWSSDDSATIRTSSSTIDLSIVTGGHVTESLPFAQRTAGHTGGDDQIIVIMEDDLQPSILAQGSGAIDLIVASVGETDLLDGIVVIDDTEATVDRMEGSIKVIDRPETQRGDALSRDIVGIDETEGKAASEADVDAIIGFIEVMIVESADNRADENAVLSAFDELLATDDRRDAPLPRE
ncbi:MAG: hypothetical protein QGG36_14080 [Pirellulaceae bacterium]|jgi:hypothetical protein|nr:hypothetical protein [Pirellulaceae bacterium]